MKIDGVINCKIFGTENCKFQHWIRPILT